MAIGGGKAYPADDESLSAWLDKVTQASGATQERANLLLGRYGSTARNILVAEGGKPTLIVDTDGYSFEEIAWIVRHESVHHVMDIITRRSLIAVNGSLTERNLADIARVCGRELGWDEAGIKAEVTRTKNELEQRHRVLVMP